MPLQSASPAPHNPLRRALLMLLLGGMIALHALIFFTLWPDVLRGQPDFTAFYSAGQAVDQGLNAQLYEQQTLAGLQRQYAPQVVQNLKGPLPYTHPPFEAAAFAPLAKLPYLAAFALWDLISAVALLASVLLLRPYLPHLRRWSGILPFLCAFAFFPVLICLVQGQDSIVLFLFFVCAFIAMEHRRQFLAGACFGLALIKFQYVLPIVAILLLRRKWRMWGGFAAAGAALTIASAAVAGWDTTLHYPQTLLSLSQAQAHLAMNAEYMPNLRGVLIRLLGRDGFAVSAILALLSVMLIAFVARRCTLDVEHRAFALEYSLVVTVSTLVSYHLETHDLILLLLPLLLIGEALFEGTIAGATRNLLFPVVATLFFSPLYALLVYRDGHVAPLFWVMALLALGIAVAIRQSRPAIRAQIRAPTGPR